jgi:hypothetical protein
MAVAEFQDQCLKPLGHPSVEAISIPNQLTLCLLYQGQGD